MKKGTTIRHGYGIQTWPDGARYEGNWALGKQHGLGKYMVPDKESRAPDLKIKHGLWEDGK